MHKKFAYINIVLLAIAVGLYIAIKKHSATPPPPLRAQSQQTMNSPSTPIGQRTKTSSCIASDGLQDSTCTPGAVFSSATKEQICVSGYSSSVRNVPSSEKDQVYQEYGITSHTTGQYEVDHLVSLELGGSNDIANLWPEAANPTPGFHQKDAVENYLHNQVCNGNVPLLTAQQEIASNWLVIYRQLHPQ